MTDGLDRFGERWSVEKYDDCFQVRDERGRFLVGVTHRQDLHSAGHTLAEKYLTESEAEIIARSIAKLRILLRRPQY